MIFRETDKYENNANVISGGEYYNMWDKYAISYKLAAEVLSEKVLSDKSNIDFLVYPVIFLYRQYFELRIKEILSTSREFNDDPIEIPLHHDLAEIWKFCEPRIKLIRPDVEQPELEKVENVLRDFCKYDKHSFSFRYPVDKEEKPTLTPLNSIDITIFLESVGSSISFLETIKGLISATIDFKDVE